MYNPDIHHRRSIRLKEYDYSDNGAYFVTICVQGRECLFGGIRDGVMTLNEAGRMVAEIWTILLDRFPNVTIDKFIVMPNHFHGIVMLADRRGESCIRPPCEPCGVPDFPDETGIDKQGESKIQGEHKVRPYGTVEKSLGRIIQAFKSTSTVSYVRGVNEQNWPPFPGRLWQRNYYERIIRDDVELTAVREYMLSNPAKWAEDKENPANV